MKPTGQVVAVLLLVTFVAAIRPSTPVSNAPPLDRREPRFSTGDEDDANARDEMEFQIARDPRTNAIPRDIRRREAEFARTMPVGRARRFGSAQVQVYQDLEWTERGPNNVGGRTRAFAVDVARPDTMIAGSVAGGIWQSYDEGASWTLRTKPGQIHSASCIAQDRRPGKTNVWYVGTGEIRGSTTNETRWGSIYMGDGIFKSTNFGQTWTLLPSTATGTPQSVDPFDYVINIATNPANLAQDEVLAATHRGIYRSVDGGGSWTQVLASDSSYTEIAITPAGAMYAVTRTGLQTRVWRSTNGTTWNVITPATFPPLVNRAVIGLAPSNNNIAYFFMHGHLSGPAGHDLWRYTYLSGDGSGAGGFWENRSGNLPSTLNTQAAYDQTIHVKPDNSNFVLLGGTELYRSTNGFGTPPTTTLVGGYNFLPNHHPDLQGGAFSPVNPNVYYSANDGGVQKTADITAPSVVWTPLNNGYNVTQLYSVAIPPDAGSNLILGGAQDNGSQLGNSPGASNWSLAFGGDGTIVEVSSAAQNRLYTQYQFGQMQRMQWNGTNVVNITPDVAYNQIFVNPIVLDPNNPALLYYAGAGPNENVISGLWRNDNAPLADTLTGWVEVPGTDTGIGFGYDRRITALGLSTANSANVLYYGTTDGVVKKAVNVNGTPTVSTITPPAPAAGTVTGGFVRSIAVDPTDANKVLVAYGNYNYPSLWYTTNGGASWTDVEGNLAGAAGPSVRCATMFYYGGQLQVFLGTSIGVLSTNALAGGATVWSQEAEAEIGNVLIAWMDYRPSDNTLAVATHGRGVFTTQFLPSTAVEPPAPSRLMLAQSYPNPATGPTTIAFELPREAEVSLHLYDVMGRQVAELAKGARGPGRHLVPVATENLAPGRYHYVLRALGAVETRSLTVRR